MDDFTKFEQLVAGRYCCISIVTHEERYALEIVRRAALDTERILAALSDSPRLSVTMAETVQCLRAWAEGRCVPAD